MVLCAANRQHRPDTCAVLHTLAVPHCADTSLIWSPYVSRTVAMFCASDCEDGLDCQVASVISDQAFKVAFPICALD